jgi:hypothetical protein
MDRKRKEKNTTIGSEWNRIPWKEEKEFTYGEKRLEANETISEQNEILRN